MNSDSATYTFNKIFYFHFPFKLKLYFRYFGTAGRYNNVVTDDNGDNGDSDGVS